MLFDLFNVVFCLTMKEAVILIPSYEPDDLLVNVVKELRENDFPVLVVNDGSGPEFGPPPAKIGVF